MKNMKKHGRKEDLQAEGQAYLMTRKAIGDKLYEKWTRDGKEVGYGLDKIYASNPNKARNVAMLLENQEKHLKQLTEAVISQNFSTRPENLLKVVRIGSANSNRGDIFTEFPLTSTDDALYFVDMTYESTLRDATAGDKIYENINRLYAGEMQETASTDGAGTQFSITCDQIPVIPGKIMVLYDRRLVGIDDGSGTITPVNTTGAINLTASPAATYQAVDTDTGIVKVEFDASVTGTNIVILSQWDSEESDLYAQYGKVALTVSKKRFNARPMPLGYTYSTMTEIVLGTTGIGNVEDMLIQAVGDEHAKSRDYKAIGIARSIALTNTTYNFDCDFAAAGEISNKSHAQKILAKIGSISGVLYDSIKRGKMNKIVAGSQALEYLKFHDLWKDDNSQVRTGVYKAGTLSDIEVFCCPADSNLIANNEILLTYKNPIEGMDVGLAFGVLTELTASLSYPQFYTDGNVATVEDYLRITDDFIKLLTLDNIAKAFS